MEDKRSYETGGYCKGWLVIDLGKIYTSAKLSAV
jgi:hypothetical protein